MNDAATAITTAAVLVDVATVSSVLLRGAPTAIDVRRLGTASAVATIVLAAQAAFAAVVGSAFLAIAFAWAFLAIALPICAVLVLVASRRRPVSVVARTVALTSLATVPISLYASFVEPFELVVERSDVPIGPERPLPRPITIAVLSDIQCVEVTDRERRAVRLAMDARPDLVLLPGDFVQVGSHRVPAIASSFRELLAPLDAPLGVFAVQGDTDTLDDARALVEGTRVRLLDDEVVLVECDGVRLALAGVSNRFGSPSALAALRGLEALEGESLRLVVAHHPDVVRRLATGSRVDLVVAGHTHGGQVVLPFVGPPITLTSLPREVGAGGLHDVDSHPLYVSRGIGWEHGHAPRVRFLCAPEVSVLTLVRRARDGAGSPSARVVR